MVSCVATRRSLSSMGRVFAAIYDRALAQTEAHGLADKRAALLAGARGDVLELGAGTGLNLPRYPRDGLGRLVLSEPDPHMARRLRARVAGERPGAEVVEADAAALPFADASFDTVVATLVMCTVDDPPRVLREVARVLRPRGRFLFLEHVRAHDARTARWQDRIRPLWQRVGAGCRPNRDTLATLRASPLEVEEVRDDRMPRTVPLVRPLLIGEASRP
jgi:ubiquinone/menaquinone biosynthesis C-methylase UbiE